MANTKLFAILEDREKVSGVWASDHYHDVSYSRFQKRLDGIEDHRPIVHRKKMFIGRVR